MAPQDQVNCVPGYPHGSNEGMDFAATYGAAPPVDMWKNDPAVKMQQQEPSPVNSYMHGMTNGSASSSMSAAPAPPPTSAAATEAAATAAGCLRTRKPSHSAGLDERFECIMEQVEAAGYDSFDSMATAYYTQNFAESSPLADEQRLSRNRRLPHVISDVYGAAATGWSEWERKGLQDEILRTAESMITGEGCGARQSLGNQVNVVLEAQDNGNLAAADEAMRAMKRTIQEEVSSRIIIRLLQLPSMKDMY